MYILLSKFPKLKSPCMYAHGFSPSVQHYTPPSPLSLPPPRERTQLTYYTPKAVLCGGSQLPYTHTGRRPNEEKRKRKRRRRNRLDQLRGSLFLLPLLSRGSQLHLYLQCIDLLCDEKKRPGSKRKYRSYVGIACVTGDRDGCRPHPKKGTKKRTTKWPYVEK